MLDSKPLVNLLRSPLLAKIKIKYYIKLKAQSESKLVYSKCYLILHNVYNLIFLILMSTDSFINYNTQHKLK